MKTCNTCRHEHTTLPDDGILHESGFYWQCGGGCNSTMFIKRARYDAIVELLVSESSKVGGTEKCDRCHEGAVEVSGDVADYFQDYYQKVCCGCRDELHAIQGRQS